MEISDLELKLEELEIDKTKVQEILDSVVNSSDSGEYSPGSVNIHRESLELMREYEPDWRKRAIISAEIIKRGL